MTDGVKANKNGKILENMIIPSLLESNFVIVSHEEWLILQNKSAAGIDLLPDRIAVRNAPYTTIYNSQGKTEFVLIAKTGAEKTLSFPNAKKGEKFVCRIECKRQEVSGSIDEKLPFLIINAELAYPEQNIIIVAEIDGAREGARLWLKDAIECRRYQTNPDKRIVQHGLLEFTSWVGRAFP